MQQKLQNTGAVYLNPRAISQRITNNRNQLRTSI